MRFVRVAVRMMAAYFNSTSETIRWHNSLPKGSLRVWRLHACCAAVSPRVPRLGKLRSTVEYVKGTDSVNGASACLFMFNVQIGGAQLFIRSDRFFSSVTFLCLELFRAFSLFQCLVPCVRVASPPSMEVRGEDGELLSFVLHSRENLYCKQVGTL